MAIFPPWEYQKYDRTYILHSETNARMYIGHFVRFFEDGSWEELHLRFWSHHPRRAMKTILNRLNNGESYRHVADQEVN